MVGLTEPWYIGASIMSLLKLNLAVQLGIAVTQRDQIGNFLKVFGNKFYNKSGPNI